MKVGKCNIISVSLPEDLIDVLGDISSANHIPRSRLINLAVELYLKVRYPDMMKILEVHRNA